MPDPLLIRCPHCGANNRVAQDKLQLGLRPVCGRCKTALPDLCSTPLTVSDATFAETVERSPLPVLLDLWSPRCAPCQILMPVIDELASQMAGRVRIAKLNADENPLTASRFNIASIPTLLILNAGQEVDRMVGVLPKTAILSRLEQVLLKNGNSS